MTKLTAARFFDRKCALLGKCTEKPGRRGFNCAEAAACRIPGGGAVTRCFRELFSDIAKRRKEVDLFCCLR